MSNQLLFHIVFSVVLHHGLGVVNFALNKSAVQSTTLFYKNFNWTADKAVDGNSDGSNPDNSSTCSATIRSTSWVNHIWEVDLGVQIIVKNITVYGRTDIDNDQLDGVKLYLGNTSQPWRYSQELTSDPSNNIQNIKYVFKPNSVIARFVSLMRSKQILTICEVTVDGECIRGTYGSGCNGTCGNCYKGNNSCSLTDGRCMNGCEAGWRGDICKSKCEAGTYGVNCNETCGYCLNGNNTCLSMNGQCGSGCQAGWMDETCKSACRSGTYGYGCNETCGNCYKGNINCLLTDGKCTEGCEAGWHGDICKLKCEAGTYGFNCNETCGYCLNRKNNCSEMNGYCSGGCQAGWTGETCKSACRSGTYGYGCNETCGNCYKGNISCLLTDGRCIEGCDAGWHGDICKLKCESGAYGFNCNETCGHCLNGKNNCSEMNGLCSSGCQTGWAGQTCKSECRSGTYGYGCNEICGNCYKGTIRCSLTDGRCMEGCEVGWHGDICKLECKAGTYGSNCNKTCGYCLNGNDNCSKTNGQCNGACEAGWTGDTCKSGTLGMVTPVDVGPNAGVIVGSVLAAVGVSIFAMVIIIVIVKKRRKRDSNETSTEHVTTAAHYANLVVGNPDAACKINVHSKTEKETTFCAIEEASLQRGMPIGTTDCHSGVKEPDVPVYNNYEKLRDVTESTESAYSTIDHSLIDEQNMDTIENCSNYVETLQSLESALTSVEKKISVLLDRKEKLLCKELERARANKLQDKRKKNNSTKSDRDKDYTNANEQRRDDLERCGNFVQMLQSLEGELRILEEKRKCLLERKEILLRQELAKTTENEK